MRGVFAPFKVRKFRLFIRYPNTNHKYVYLNSVKLGLLPYGRIYRGADKPLARPGRKISYSDKRF